MVSQNKTAGRPREFDLDQALDAAIEVFWRRGFEGASLTDLTAAMELSRPSVYAAFGNKETLFRKALARYAETRTAAMSAALQAPHAKDAVERFLREFVASATDPATPPGCLTVQGGVAPDASGPAIHAALAKVRQDGHAALTLRLQQAIDEQDLPSDCDPADLALYVTTLTQGIAVQAASGTTRPQLARIVDRALAAWPH
jgi:AcrR family transcriptional regulator